MISVLVVFALVSALYWGLRVRAKRRRLQKLEELRQAAMRQEEYGSADNSPSSGSWELGDNAVNV